MKYSLLILALPALIYFSGCTQSIKKYQVGEYDVYITDPETVNQEWRKIPEKGKQQAAFRVNGFINYRDREIWSIGNTETLIHEFKHMLEGNFHPPGAILKPVSLGELKRRKSTDTKQAKNKTTRHAAAFQDNSEE